MSTRTSWHLPSVVDENSRIRTWEREKWENSANMREIADTDVAGTFVPHQQIIDIRNVKIAQFQHFQHFYWSLHSESMRQEIAVCVRKELTTTRRQLQVTLLASRDNVLVSRWLKVGREMKLEKFVALRRKRNQPWGFNTRAHMQYHMIRLHDSPFPSLIGWRTCDVMIKVILKLNYIIDRILE